MLHDFPNQHWPTAKITGPFSASEQQRPQQETLCCCQCKQRKTSGEKGWAPFHQKEQCQGRKQVTWDVPLGATSLLLFWENLVETPWARNGKSGVGFGRLSNTGSLLTSEIPRTGVWAPSAVLDHTFPGYQWPLRALEIKQQWALLHNFKCNIQNPVEIHIVALYIHTVYYTYWCFHYFLLRKQTNHKLGNWIRITVCLQG